MKISNATVTSKQNFIEKYLYSQNCSWKNEGSINRVSEISKIHSLHGLSLLQTTVDLSPFEQIIRKHLNLYIIQPISVTSGFYWDVFFSPIIIMSFPLQGFYFFIIFFLVFFNQLSKFLFFSQTILFFTSNECFSHFNVQQLLLNISHFVLFSQAHLKITLKTKTFEKIYFIRFY